MQCGSSVFQKHCQTAIEKLTENDINNFKNTNSDEDRIQFIYSFAKTIPCGVKTSTKNKADALLRKKTGNDFFAKKEYPQALATYNYGIRVCPQNEDPERELLSVLISNRSATFFEMGDYKRALSDIDYLTDTGSYPKHLLYKALLRKAKCHDSLQEKGPAESSYRQALETLKFANLDEKSLKKKAEEIAKYKAMADQMPPQTTKPSKTTEPTFPKGDVYVSAHKGVAFDEDEIQGRYARAVQDIALGTTIVEENAHCAVLVSEKALTNCQHCLKATIQPIACKNCTEVIFCSLECAKAANYHKFECSIHPVVSEYGASINCSMALRIITQRDLDFFLNMKDKLDAKFSGKKRIYEYSDYRNVYHLCRNEKEWRKEHLIHYACMAVFLLRLLKKTPFFPPTSEDDTLTENERYIGSLILRHLQFLQFNAHEISELCNAPASQDGSRIGYKSEYIGGGVYPTLALFNHSCDPSIVRYNVGSKIIVRTIKPIKAGDVIYENYGALYTTMAKDRRQAFLKERYWFECLCKPCVEMWPMLSEMDENIVRIPCKNRRCPKVFDLGKDLENPFLTCNLCRESTSVFPFLKGLMELEQILPEAEYFYNQGEYEEADSKFLDALKIYHEYSVPPFPDMVNVQQRLRTCMLHAGNKCVGYRDPSKL